MIPDPDTSYTNGPPADTHRPDSGLEARLVTYADAPDELTVFPREVPEGARATTWITAQAGSFVALEDWR